MLEPADLLIAVFVSASEGCSLNSTVATSRCKGDECTGELDFLLAASPLPPREEFRGETLPVCCISLVANISPARERFKI